MRRARIVLLTLIACTAGPVVAGPAAAQSVTQEGCRDSLGLLAPCVGVGKLGERASAECRRFGVVDDEACSTRVGRRVVRAEITKYQSSDTHRTLAFQYALAGDIPLRNAPWAGTHNSFNSTSEDPTASHTDSNQQLSLTDQLRLDVRSLELDVHWLPSPRAGGAFAPVVCHGQGSAGCTTERLLADRLPEIRTWLDDHRDQVLLLYLEDQIDDPAGYDAAAKVVRDTFGKRLYKPRGPGCTTVPLQLTRDAIVAAGAQVLIVSNCGSGAWPGVAHQWPSSVRFEDRPHGYRPYPACGPPGPGRSEDLIVRYFEDSTFVSPAAEPTGMGSPDDGLTPATVRAMVRCGVDLFGFDQLLPGDGRLDALTWSWAPGEPRESEGACAVQRDDGRWETASCREPHRPACRSAGGRWTVLAKRVQQRLAEKACARARLLFATPRTGAENAALGDAAPDGASVWLSLRS